MKYGVVTHWAKGSSHRFVTTPNGEKYAIHENELPPSHKLSDGQHGLGLEVAFDAVTTDGFCRATNVLIFNGPINGLDPLRG